MTGSAVVVTGSPTITHTYATGGCAGTVPSPSCDATVTETDAAGGSAGQVFTGQTVSLNGSGAVTASTNVTIAVADCTTNNTCQAAVTTTGYAHVATPGRHRHRARCRVPDGHPDRHLGSGSAELLT